MPNPSIEPLLQAHSLDSETVLTRLETTPHGLSSQEARDRALVVGSNRLPSASTVRLRQIILNQFRSPLIAVLLLAALLSAVLQVWSDAAFILIVLLINAAIGSYQEHRAERSAQALRHLIALKARALRDGAWIDIAAETLVPGDLVLLESGSKIPADIRLIDAQHMTVDESVLTGEAMPVTKNADMLLHQDAVLGDRCNMVFAGTLVHTGRARGVVTATGAHTALGHIATAVLQRAPSKPPLLLRMERFTRRVSLFIGVCAILLIVVSLMQGVTLAQTLMMGVALAVSAIPEGLPVALTVALAVGMERMARRGAVVRRLVAVEALGSCTFIASDKTGTLTVNQLTVRAVQWPDDGVWNVTGEGLEPVGQMVRPDGSEPDPHTGQTRRPLALTCALCNEASLTHEEGRWIGQGDSVDLALLVFAHKLGLDRERCLTEMPEVARIPYEPEQRFAATLNRVDQETHVFVKGAVESLLTMCSHMRSGDAPAPLDGEHITEQAQGLAARGYRVLAAASGPLSLAPGETLALRHLQGLCFEGLLAMSDPPRPEARDAIRQCRGAGISVAMVTGDHPSTALAVARDLGLASSDTEVAHGNDLSRAALHSPAAFDALCANTRIFARVEPQQKLQIVESLQRQGHFVAVTGDGANDAPALRAAQVGVAMGQRGTDVARESSDIVITDDDFASIVGGIEEGRIAYANVRKVIALLIATGAAEIVLFMLSLFAGLPLPLMAVQLLWLNLVTNGIQDVALAFEPGEGRELRQSPRPPQQGIFDRPMLERVVLSALTMGVVAFGLYAWLLRQGWDEAQARNSVLLLMVLFENLHAFNCRSERTSMFQQNPWRNPFLLFGALGAQLLHIGAMVTPGLRDVLGVQPVPMQHWLMLAGMALSLVAVVELHKLLLRARPEQLRRRARAVRNARRR